MSQALQQLINGLTLGAVYGLIAIGYTMVYGIIGMINFAHGDIYMVSAFIAVTCFTLLAGSGISLVVASIAITLIVSIALGSLPWIEDAIRQPKQWEVCDGDDGYFHAVVAKGVFDGSISLNRRDRLCADRREGP
jgi:hypothetical protein